MCGVGEDMKNPEILVCAPVSDVLAVDSAANMPFSQGSSPRSVVGGGGSISEDQISVKSDDLACPKVKFMCSYGGKILPRPHDSQLRYVGGETRIVVVNRNISYADLMAKLGKLMGRNIVVKYQLPNEDLDALVSVVSDEDLENMMEEHDRLEARDSSSKLRIFLFQTRPSSGGSGQEPNAEQQFVDAVNGLTIKKLQDGSSATSPRYLNSDAATQWDHQRLVTSAAQGVIPSKRPIVSMQAISSPNPNQVFSSPSPAGIYSPTIRGMPPVQLPPAMDHLPNVKMQKQFFSDRNSQEGGGSHLSSPKASPKANNAACKEDSLAKLFPDQREQTFSLLSDHGGIDSPRQMHAFENMELKNPAMAIDLPPNSPQHPVSYPAMQPVDSLPAFVPQQSELMLSKSQAEVHQPDENLEPFKDSEMEKHIPPSEFQQDSPNMRHMEECHIVIDGQIDSPKYVDMGCQQREEMMMHRPAVEAISLVPRQMVQSHLPVFDGIQRPSSEEHVETQGLQASAQFVHKNAAFARPVPGLPVQRMAPGSMAWRAVACPSDIGSPLSRHMGSHLNQIHRPAMIYSDQQQQQHEAFLQQEAFFQAQQNHQPQLLRAVCACRDHMSSRSNQRVLSPSRFRDCSNALCRDQSVQTEERQQQHLHQVVSLWQHHNADQHVRCIDKSRISPSPYLLPPKAFQDDVFLPPAQEPVCGFELQGVVEGRRH